MRKLAWIGMLTLVAGVAYGGSITTPHVAGGWQGWDPGANPMVQTAAGSDIWTLTVSGLAPGERQVFKITDGTWGTALPSADSWFYADGAGNMTITYDGNTYADGWLTAVDRINTSDAPATWNAVGDWQNQVGGGDWDNANPNTAMSALGGGLYSLTATLAPGDYKWKAVVDGTWDSISMDNRSVGTADWLFSTDAVKDTVTFEVDALTGVARIDIVPEPSTMLLALAGLGLLLARRVRH